MRGSPRFLSRFIMKPVYLPMPVTFEEKRAWNAKGYRVYDIAFMPEGYDNPAAVRQEEPKKKAAK